ncbi:MAG: hypothetical protein R3C59_00205 [Planctomycetaceae bacterium]
MSLRQKPSLLSDPANVIALGATVFPISLVLLSIEQSLMAERLPSKSYLVLAVLSGIFCTLAICLTAHSFVNSSERRGTVSIQIAVGLTLIWGGFLYCFTHGHPLAFLFEELRLATAPQSMWIVENRDGVDWLVSANQRGVEAGTPATQALFAAVLFAFMAAPYCASWALVNLFSGTRFRILMSMTCVSWVIVVIAWRHNESTESNVRHNPAAISADTTVQLKEKTQEVGNDQLPPAEKVSETWHFSELSSVAIAILFAIPAYFSVPFMRLFIVTFMDANEAARIWLVSTVSSLLIIFLMTLLGPRLVPDHAISFANAGLVLSMLSAWIMMPTIYDSRMLWISNHVCGLTWMAGGFILLGRPWRMEHQELVRALCLLIPAVTLTLLHLLLGLYESRLLRRFKSFCWMISEGLVVTAAILLYFEKAPTSTSFSCGLWMIILIVPYAEKPPEFTYLTHAFSQKLSLRRLTRPIRKLLNLGTLTEDPKRGSIATRFYETRDPEIQNAISDSDFVRFIIRPFRAEWRDAAILVVVISAMIGLAISVSMLNANANDSFEFVRNNLPWFGGTVLLFWLASWLLVKRYHTTQQALVLCNDHVGWWAGSEFEWWIPYESIRDIRVWSQMIAIVAKDGNQITTKKLSQSGALASAGFIQSKNFKEAAPAVMQSLRQQGHADIGPMRFSWLGLTLRQNTIHWSDIESIHLNANGISVAKKGGPGQWAFISARHLSNPMCLKMLVYFFFGMQKFLSEVTGVIGVSPADFERVCRSVNGLDEFGLLDEDRLTKAVISVFSYQLPHSFSHLTQVAFGLGEFPGELSLDQIAIGEAWRELLNHIASHLPMPARLCELLQPTEDLWIRGITAFVEHEAERTAAPC